MPIADCCGPLPARFQTYAPRERRSAEALRSLSIEDQDGEKLSFGAFFTGKPTILAFFYSRCTNPNKCSLTITNLARLQQALQEQGLADCFRIAAFTYDPLYDHAARLKTFGESRGFRFDADSRFFRVPVDFEMLRSYFDLGVNFLGTLVNRHRIELFLLDEQGHIRSAATRLQWDVAEVLAQAKALLPPPATPPSPPVLRASAPAFSTGVLSMLPPVVIAFFPKCPMCWAAYLSVFGVERIRNLPYSPWLLPLFIGILFVQLFCVYRRARATGRWQALLLCLLGAGLVSAGAWQQASSLSLSGIVLLGLGAMLNSAPHRSVFAKGRPDPHGA